MNQTVLHTKLSIDTLKEQFDEEGQIKKKLSIETFTNVPQWLKKLEGVSQQ
jgi:hypothetical protein